MAMNPISSAGSGSLREWSGSMTYTMSITVTKAYDETVEAIRSALSDQGFGVLTEIDVAATLGGVLRMLEDGRYCEEVVTQLVAVSRALDRAGFAIVASGLQQCLAGGDGMDSVDAKKMEKLFLSLA